MTNGNIKTFHRGGIIHARGEAGGDLISRRDAVQTAIGTVAEQTGVIRLQQRGVVVADFTLIAVRHVQILHARFQRLGESLLQVAFKDHFAVDFKLRHYAADGLFIVSAVGGIVLIEVALLVVSRQQLGFGIQTAPTVGQRQVDRRFEVNAGRFRHVVIRVNKMGNLSIEMGIERTDIILVVVDVELRLSRIGVARFAVKDLELFGRYRGVKVLVDVTGAEFLRRIAVGTGTIFRAEVVEVVRIADLGVVSVQTPYLIDNP